jgi:DNA-binding LytR/AlgR family response regulator
VGNLYAIAMSPTALIAEDEPLLAAALKAELSVAWPQLQIVATVGDGESAIREALTLLPDVLFFDIHMPVMSGLQAAAALADAWPMPVNPNSAIADTTARPFPALVFITAYDQYAVQAFEAQAIDYLLKPVQAARLKKTVEKVRSSLANQKSAAVDFESTLAQLRGLLEATQDPSGPAPRHTSAVPAPLRVIQASVGNTVRMVPIDDVVYFEAADKYVRVMTATHEYLIRTPLKDLLPQLDAQSFWQVHRGTLVRANCIDAVTRDEAGKLWLSLRGCAQQLSVSRLYAHLFKAM